MISQEQLQHLLSLSLSLLSFCSEVLFRPKGCVHVSSSPWDFVSRKLQLIMFPFQSESSQSRKSGFPLDETKPKYVMWNPEDIQLVGQEQQQSKLKIRVGEGVKPSALDFLLYRSTPLGQHYLL